MRTSVGPLLFGFSMGLALVMTLTSAAAPPAPPVVAQRPSPEPATRCIPAPLRERAAQVLVVGLPQAHRADDPQVIAVTELGVGGVVIGETNVYNAAQVRRLVTAVREGSRYPVLLTAVEEPGRVHTFGRVLGRFSPPRQLAEQPLDDVEMFATQLGTELANLGIDLALAPVADVDGGSARRPIGDRSFSGDPGEASRYAVAFSRGLMAGGVMPAAKYFPGSGRLDVDPARGRGLVAASIEQLRQQDLVPFEAQISLGVPVVVVGHAAYTAFDPDLPASLTPAVYDLLRDLGFEGVALTHFLGQRAVTTDHDVVAAAVAAISAGADAVLVNDGRLGPDIVDALVAAVAEGRLTQDRLTAAAARMMRLKGADGALMACSRSFDARERPRPTRAR